MQPLTIVFALLLSQSTFSPRNIAQAEVAPEEHLWVTSHYGELPAGQSWNALQDGSVFHPNRDFIAAHRTLPIGTRLLVTRPDNPRRSIVVTVLDRGPFIHGRQLDLSTAAARALGFYEQGIATLSVQVLR